MFDIRLRAYSPDGTRGRVIQTLDIDSTDAESATASLTFSTSSLVAERMEAPFVVGLEYTTGSSWARPRNDLYIILSDAEDAIDQTGVMTFTAQSYVAWLLSQGIHWWNWDSKDDRTRSYDMTPGKLIRQFLYEAQVETTGVVRGWAPMLTTDVTDTKDSLGQPWLPADQIKMSLDLWRPYSSFFQTWTEQGHFEWWAEGTKLRMARVGSGVDRTSSLSLGGPGFSAAPAKTNFGGTFTRIVLIPDGAIALGAENTNADSRFGALETSMTLSGVNDQATALRQAQPVMQENRAKKLELSYDWVPAAGGPRPWLDFTIGDSVTARRKSGKQPQRVIGLQMSKREGIVTARAIVGSKLVGLQAKIAKRVGSVSQGQIIGGSGAGIPANPGVAPSAPSVPTALRVASNTGSWRADGTAVSEVKIAWDAVATSAEGTPLDVDRYEVASRRGFEVAQFETSTSSLEATFTRWPPGVTRYVSVRARSVRGVWSPWSDEIAVVPEVPQSIVPKPPTGLAIESNVGRFQSDGTAVATVTVTWQPVTLSTDDVPVDIAEYQAMVGLDAKRTTATSVTFTIPTGAAVSVTAKARTTLGVWGDPSLALAVVGAEPPVNMTPPSNPDLSGGMGGIACRWDGLLATGAPAAGFGFVLTETSPSAQGPWTQSGTPLSSGGVQFIPGVIGDTVYVRFRATDTLGRAGGTSGVESASISGIALNDLDPEIVGAIDAVRFTADGKNRVYTSVTEPPREQLAQGDLWWVLDATATGIVGIQVWNGEKWVEYLLAADRIIAAESITSPLIAAGTIKVSHVEAGFGGALNIEANDSITLAAGRLDQIELYVRIDADAMHLGRPDGKSELELAPEGITLKQNNVAISKWIGGVFIAQEAQLDTAQIGNHQWLSYGEGRTIVRPL